MKPTADLLTALDDRLGDLPSLPPEHYLVAGRLAGRRRRRRRAGVAAGLVVAGVVVAGQLAPSGHGPGPTGDTNVATGSVHPVDEGSLSSLPVAAGLGSIDGYTTDDIPDWASEYGNHGPVAIAPDGRLWIAPEATVVRSIADPFGDAAASADVSRSYAIEARWESPDHDAEKSGGDGLVWSFVYQVRGQTGTFGQLDDPGRWTADFAVWAEDAVAGSSGLPRFAEQLVRFDGDRSADLVPGPGVEIVRQRTDVGTGDRQQYARQTAAELRVGDQTWFVLASGRKVGHAFYEAWDVPAVGGSTLDGFLRFVDAGMVTPAGNDS